jgi:hypothetical protein
MMDRTVWFLGWLLGQKSLPLPLYVFAATCLFFLVLDLMADDRARAAISEWLKPRNVSVPATAAANAIRAVFDLFYALPLLFTAHGRAYKRTLGPTDWTPFKAWWALVPSALIAVISTFVLTYYVFTSSRTEVDTTFWSGIAVNIISNYLALFVIRRWLFTDEANPQEALFFAVFAAILLVISFTGLRLVIFMMINEFFFAGRDLCDAGDFCKHVSADGHGLSYLAEWDRAAVQHMWPTLRGLHLPGIIAACFVHLWLPLFAISAFLLQSLNFMLYPVKGIEEGMKAYVGRNHPVFALGVFAGLLAAFALVLLQWLAPLMS